MSPVLAVDLGTTTTSAVLVDGGCCTPIREPASGLDAWPSSVCADGDGLVVGTRAESLRRSARDGYEAEPKRLLGRVAKVTLGDQVREPWELAAAVLASVRQEAERVAGRPVRRVTLTVPAGVAPGDPYRGLLERAAEHARFTEVELLPEPVAAALAPVEGRPFAPGDLVLVHDLGGGTFDTALLRIESEGHTILGVDSRPDLGGRDLDDLVRTHLRRAAGPLLDDVVARQPDPDRREIAVRLVDTELRDHARDLKHDLSGREAAAPLFTLALAPLGMSRAELEEAAAPLLAETVACCRRLLERARADLADLTAVLVVGGSARMPVLCRTLVEAFGDPVRMAADPQRAVVDGAARHVATADRRRVAARRPAPSGSALRWEIPDGAATFSTWLVEPGTAYAAGTPLARVRLLSGQSWELTAERPGRFERGHRRPGEPVASGDWIATVTSARQDDVPLLDPVERAWWDRTADWAHPLGADLVVTCVDGIVATLDVGSATILSTLPVDGVLALSWPPDRLLARVGDEVVPYDTAAGARQPAVSVPWVGVHAIAVDGSVAHWRGTFGKRHHKGHLSVHQPGSNSWEASSAQQDVRGSSP